MKKLVLFFSVMLVLFLVDGYAMAGGDQNCGDIGKGDVNQHQNRLNQ